MYVSIKIEVSNEKRVFLALLQGRQKFWKIVQFKRPIFAQAPSTDKMGRLFSSGILNTSACTSF
ncbi:hypothetical protein T01_3988 [Trichinella spiralis]|uniref:Uncharacterized protein n=1 Tax=Trichinella spiralis TaxID=6334 RepID=A0A0V1AVU8_TRISP|nr:hypothetical protein T01_3988 [Trichinella spiralis]